MTDAFDNELSLGDIVVVTGSHQPNYLLNKSYVIRFTEKSIYVLWRYNSGNRRERPWIGELLEKKEFDTLYEKLKNDKFCNYIHLHRTTSNNLVKIYGLNK